MAGVESQLLDRTLMLNARSSLGTGVVRASTGPASSVTRRFAMSCRAQASAGGLRHLGAVEAAALDTALMSDKHGFSIDQLMELAGLSVASAVAEVYSPARVLLFCGPGNNGGDGLVAARHLHHFGFKPTVCYPRGGRSSRPSSCLYSGLVKQLEALAIPFLEVEQALELDADVVIDAMFGFSFKGEPRPPFDSILARLAGADDGPPIVSVDIPSGWQVEQREIGDREKLIRPDMLVSLTAPKVCARLFQGRHHYLGGRFVPPEIKEAFKLDLPAYPGTSQCVRIG